MDGSGTYVSKGRYPCGSALRKRKALRCTELCDRQKLTALRDEGYLIFGSGNVVHNLMRVEWDNDGGTPMTLRFNKEITDAVLSAKKDIVIRYDQLQDASYAVPTPDHFLPLLYCLGATEGNQVKVFNNICNLGSMAMTGYLFETIFETNANA